MAILEWVEALGVSLLDANELDNSTSPILALARTIEAKDPYTAGHTWRVANYGRMLATALGYSSRQVGELTIAGCLHDIGKIAVPDEILTKPGELTPEEELIMQRHPRDGYDFLRFDRDFMGALDVVLMHHEAYDGSGYPIGLDGENIPPSARLFAIVDAFDAITSSRPYRGALDPEIGIEAILSGRGVQFDPEMADRFVELYRQGALVDIIGHSDFGVRVGRCPTCGPVIEVRADHNPGDALTCRVCGAIFCILNFEEREPQLEQFASTLRFEDDHEDSR